MDLVVQCYRLCDQFPRSEEFGLKSQLKRSVVSIPSNTAEGHGRPTTGEHIHHLGIAYGSLMEVETHLQIAARLNYIKAEQLREALQATAEIGRMTNGLVCRLRQRRDKRQPRSPIPDP